MQTDALQTFTPTLRLECSEKERFPGNLQNTAIIRKKKTAMFSLTNYNKTLMDESFFFLLKTSP